jgi:hypothetical protein
MTTGYNQLNNFQPANLEEHQMTRTEVKPNNSFIVFTVVLIITLLSTLNAQNPNNSKEAIKSGRMELILANFERGLCSENHGVRMGAVQHVGRYKMSKFEDCLIELLDKEEKQEDKEIIALSLFQIGSLNSINALKNVVKNSDNEQLKSFCFDLLRKYDEYDKLRTDYFEDLVVSINDQN